MQRRSFLAALFAACMSAGSVFGLCRKPKPVMEVLVHKFKPVHGMGDCVVGVIVGHSEAAEAFIRKYLSVAYAVGNRRTGSAERGAADMLVSWPPLQKRQSYLIEAMKKHGYLVVGIAYEDRPEIAAAWSAARDEVTVISKEIDFDRFCTYYEAYTDKFLG